MRLIRWIPVSAGAVLASGLACGSLSSSSHPPADASTPDAAPGDDVVLVAGPIQPDVVLVNGLLSGVASSSLTLTDVRVCLPGAQYPLPDDKTMPLANYPGVGLGDGADLGGVSATGNVTIDVFNASDLQYDTPWQPSTNRLTCAQITCSTGAACRKHVELQATLEPAINLLVLSDDVPGQSVKITTATLDPSYSGTPGIVRAQVANFSGWQKGQNVEATFGTDRTNVIATLAAPLGDGTVSATATLDPSGDYEGHGVWVNQVTDAGQTNATFGQSLGSIQWVSDPTTAPQSFYDVRENFALVLIGDPQNLMLSSDGRDPAYDGRALHFVAVPFAAGTPAK